MRSTLIVVLIGSFVGNLIYHYLENESYKDDMECASEIFNKGLDLGLNNNNTKN